MEDFSRIRRLPPYVFALVGDLKMRLRRQNIDIVDFSMGNPDIPTPPHIVEKLVEAAQKPGKPPLFPFPRHSQSA